MDKKTYTDLMNKIAEGHKVTQEVYEELVTFAKAKKIKRPAESAIISDEEILEEKATKKAKAKGPKPVCSVTHKEDAKMAKGEACTNPSRSNGMCSKHYSRLVFRAVPENMEKAREASRKYAARVREEKAAAKAAAAAASAA